MLHIVDFISDFVKKDGVMKTVAEYKEILSHGTVHPATVWGVFDRFYNKAGDLSSHSMFNQHNHRIVFFTQPRSDFFQLTVFQLAFLINLNEPGGI